jgi:hypothetical protein
MIFLNSQGIADEEALIVQLRPIAGAYELFFGTTITVLKPFDKVRWLTLFGARVTALFGGGAKLDLGLASLEQPVVLRQHEGPGIMRQQCRFVVPLQPNQLGAIEECRAGGDINFELMLAATGGDQQRGAYEQPAPQSLRAKSAESDWVTQLNSAKALNILLIEVPMPFVNPSKASKAIDNHLRNAQSYFVNADYRQCIAECRQAMEEIGNTEYGAAKTLIDGDKNSMTKEEREQVLAAMLHHYTQLSAHSVGRGGYLGYTRADAKLALTLVAAFAAHRVC